MPGIAEIGAELAETALTFAPWLEDIPILGRVFTIIAPGGGNDFKALEQLQAQANKKKTDREARVKRNGRYVIKASDAMQCVEDNGTSATFLLSLGKTVLNNVAGRASISAADLVVERIFDCIDAKVLKQTGARTARTGRFYHRPSRGHGHGRVTGTKPPPPPQPQGLPPKA